jgi:fibronectin-binding autotransporter adhesin
VPGVYRGKITGIGGTLVKDGSATLTLTGINNDYTGDTTILNGTLQLGDGSGSNGNIAGNVVNNAILAFETISPLPQTFANTITGSGMVTKLGTRMLILAGNNSYTGGTLISGGTVQLQSPNALGTGDLAITAGTLDLNGKTVSVGALSGSPGTQIISSGTNNLTVSPNAGVATTYDGTITTGVNDKLTFIHAGNGTTILSGANTMAAVWINAGTLGFSPLSLGSAGPINFGGGVLQYNAGNTADVSSRLVANQPVAIDTNGNNVAFGTPIRGIGGSLQKYGTGSLTLLGDNSYGAGSTVNAGMLLVNGTLSGTGVVNVNNSATLGGSGSIAGMVIVNSGGHINPAGVGIAGTLTGSGGLTAQAGSIFDFDLGTTSASDKIIVSRVDGLTLNGGTVNIANLSGFGAGTYTLMTYSGAIAGAGTGSLSLGALPAGYNGSLVASNTAIMLNVLHGTAVWNLATGGNWSVAGNWLSGWVPNGADGGAILGSTLSGSQTVTLDTAVTVGQLTIATTGGASYTISGSNGIPLTLQSADNATVNVLSGSHTVNADVVLASPAVISVTDSLTINGAISESGGARSLTKSGSGMLTLCGSNSYTGATTVSGGTLNLSGSGRLTGGPQYIGSMGNGTFAQTGGTNAISGDCYLGFDAASAGNYNLSGAARLTAGNQYVGYSGVGAFTQSGGTNAIASNLFLANASGAHGTYNLNGGLLLTGSVSHGAGTAAFNLGGGTLQAASSFTTTVPITLSGGNSTIDTASFDVTVSGNLAGSGSLTKAGLGTLALMGSNSYAGDTTVNAGMLTALALTGTDSTITVGGDVSLTATLAANYIHVHKLVIKPGSSVILGGVSAAAAAVEPSSDVASNSAVGSAGIAASTVPEPSAFALLGAGVIAALAYIILPNLRRGSSAVRLAALAGVPPRPERLPASARKPPVPRPVVGNESPSPRPGRDRR